MDGVIEGEVKAGTPESEEEVIVVVPEALHEGFVEAVDFLDVGGRDAGDEAKRPGHFAADEEPWFGADDEVFGGGVMAGAEGGGMEVSAEFAGLVDVAGVLDDFGGDHVEEVAGGVLEGGVPGAGGAFPAWGAVEFDECGFTGDGEVIVGGKGAGLGFWCGAIEDDDEFVRGVPGTLKGDSDLGGDFWGAVVDGEDEADG